jgi:hypothetical protein
MLFMFFFPSMPEGHFSNIYTIAHSFAALPEQ